MDRRVLAFAALLALVLVVGYRLWKRLSVENISVHEVKARLKAGLMSPLLVDVREPHEYRKGHIPGAVNIPLESLEQKAMHMDSDTEIILVCRNGNRSTTAYRRLKAMGFTRVRNLEGGMKRWPWDTVSQ